MKNKMLIIVILAFVCLTVISCYAFYISRPHEAYGSWRLIDENKATCEEDGLAVYKNIDTNETIEAPLFAHGHLFASDERCIYCGTTVEEYNEEQGLNTPIVDEEDEHDHNHAEEISETFSQEGLGTYEN